MPTRPGRTLTEAYITSLAPYEGGLPEHPDDPPLIGERVRTIYRFDCIECGEEHEELCDFEKIPDVEANGKCVMCGGDLKQVITCGLVIFKGTGFTRERT